LYTWEGEEQDCVILVIQTGPQFKDFKPKEVVLVNTGGYCYIPNTVQTGRVRVDGILTSGFPLCRKTGKPLVMHTKDEAKTFEERWFIKVKRLEPLP
jgi:flavodoxin